MRPPPVYAVTELLYGCQQKLVIYLTGHPVQSPPSPPIQMFRRNCFGSYAKDRGRREVKYAVKYRFFGAKVAQRPRTRCMLWRLRESSNGFKCRFQIQPQLRSNVEKWISRRAANMANIFIPAAFSNGKHALSLKWLLHTRCWKTESENSQLLCHSFGQNICLLLQIYITSILYHN